MGLEFDESGEIDQYLVSGFVVETTEIHAEGPGKFWRDGHKGNEFYNAVRGLWRLSKAKIFFKKNEAIRKCVELGHEYDAKWGKPEFRVREVIIKVGECVYPPSQCSEPKKATT